MVLVSLGEGGATSEKMESNLGRTGERASIWFPKMKALSTQPNVNQRFLYFINKNKKSVDF